MGTSQTTSSVGTGGSSYNNGFWNKDAVDDRPVQPYTPPQSNPAPKPITAQQAKDGGFYGDNFWKAPQASYQKPVAPAPKPVNTYSAPSPASDPWAHPVGAQPSYQAPKVAPQPAQPTLQVQDPVQKLFPQTAAERTLEKFWAGSRGTSQNTPAPSQFAAPQAAPQPYGPLAQTTPQMPQAQAFRPMPSQGPVNTPTIPVGPAETSSLGKTNPSIAEQMKTAKALQTPKPRPRPEAAEQAPVEVVKPLPQPKAPQPAKAPKPRPLLDRKVKDLPQEVAQANERALAAIMKSEDPGAHAYYTGENINLDGTAGADKAAALIQAMNAQNPDLAKRYEELTLKQVKQQNMGVLHPSDGVTVQRGPKIAPNVQAGNLIGQWQAVTRHIESLPPGKTDAQAYVKAIQLEDQITQLANQSPEAVRGFRNSLQSGPLTQERQYLLTKLNAALPAESSPTIQGRQPDGGQSMFDAIAQKATGLNLDKQPAKGIQVASLGDAPVPVRESDIQKMAKTNPDIEVAYKVASGEAPEAALVMDVGEGSSGKPSMADRLSTLFREKYQGQVTTETLNKAQSLLAATKQLKQMDDLNTEIKGLSSKPFYQRDNAALRKAEGQLDSLQRMFSTEAEALGELHSLEADTNKPMGRSSIQAVPPEIPSAPPAEVFDFDAERKTLLGAEYNLEQGQRIEKDFAKQGLDISKTFLPGEAADVSAKDRMTYQNTILSHASVKGGKEVLASTITDTIRYGDEELKTRAAVLGHMAMQSGALAEKDLPETVRSAIEGHIAMRQQVAQNQMARPQEQKYLPVTDDPHTYGQWIDNNLLSKSVVNAVGGEGLQVYADTMKGASSLAKAAGATSLEKWTKDLADVADNAKRTNWQIDPSKQNNTAVRIAGKATQIALALGETYAAGSVKAVKTVAETFVLVRNVVQDVGALSRKLDGSLTQSEFRDKVVQGVVEATARHLGLRKGSTAFNKFKGEAAKSVSATIQKGLFDAALVEVGNREKEIKQNMIADENQAITPITKDD